MEWDDKANEFRESAARLKQEALKLRQTVLDEAPSPAHGWLLVVKIEEEFGRLDQAILASRRYLALCAEPALPVLNHLGHLLFRTGHYASAAICFRTTSLAEPKAHRWNMYAMCAAELGLSEEAVRAWRRAIACEPDFGELYVNLASHLLRQGGELETACRYARKALELDADCVSGYWGVLECALRRGDHERAIEHARKGLSLDPEDIRCRVRLAESLHHLGRGEEAEEEFRAALRRSQYDDVATRVSWACFLAAQGRYEEAQKEFRALLRAWPDDELPYESYASFLERQLGRKDEALKVRAELDEVRRLLGLLP